MKTCDYEFNKYVYSERWWSYYFQLKLINQIKPDTLLEIGVGDGFLGNYIKSIGQIKYKSLDASPELNPDIVASVENIPLPDNSFSAVCAFEVLEHLPFEKFEKSLTELKRVSREYVILSLPHFGPMLKFNFKIPFLREINFYLKLPAPMKHKFNGEHYWEIGKRNYSPKKIRRLLQKYFKIEDEFLKSESPYHRFYLLRNK